MRPGALDGRTVQPKRSPASAVHTIYSPLTAISDHTRLQKALRIWRCDAMEAGVEVTRVKSTGTRKWIQRRKPRERSDMGLSARSDTSNLDGHPNSETYALKAAQNVAPFQGSASEPASSPRALPWAGLFQAVGLFQSFSIAADSDERPGGSCSCWTRFNPATVKIIG